MESPIYRDILINNSKVNTVLIKMPNANIIIASTGRGFVMCGYLDIAIADKLGDVACIVSNISTVDELLKRPVIKISAKAKQLGVCLGASGQQALEKML